MIEFGKTLREAREAKGLTTSQIADTTHLLPQIVEDLENEDFHRISAPIYGRGFVKLYCEAVGIEAKPLVDEFMAILNGERTPAIRLREIELPTEPVEAPPPPPVYTQPELGAIEEDEVEEPAASPAAAPLPPRAADPLAAPHQYHPGYTHATPPLPPNLGRIAILAGGAIAIIALLIWGGRALYRATMTAPEANEQIEAVEAVKTPTDKPAAAKPQTKRTPKAVKPLYID